MNAIQNISSSVTISSLEISEITGKKHKNVIRDIERQLSELQKDRLKFELIYKDSQNREQKAYSLDREQAMILVTGYSIPLRARVIQRLEQLENSHLPKTFPEALRLYANQVEQNEILALENKELERTKAFINNKKTATAMNTASRYAKINKKLEQELDTSKEYATVKRMQLQNHGIQFNWRLLKSTGIEMGIEAIEVFDANYGTVKAYHKDVWKESYGLDI